MARAGGAAPFVQVDLVDAAVAVQEYPVEQEKCSI
jgi:hypothetical protein